MSGVSEGDDTIGGLRNKLSTAGSIYRNGGRKEMMEACLGYVEKYWAPMPVAYAVRAKYAVSPPADDRVFRIRVDPQEIEYVSRISRSDVPAVGENAIVGSIGGPWDRFRGEFSKRPMYRSVERRIVDGVPWEETSRVKYKLDRGVPRAVIRDECERIDTMIENIDRHGYLSQEELASSDPERGRVRKTREIRSLETPDELVVALCRDGTFMRVAGGRHRLAVAQVLGVPEIPAILTMRHSAASMEEVEIDREYVARPLQADQPTWTPVSD